MTSSNSAVVEIVTDGVNFRYQLTPKQLGFTLEKTDDAVRASEQKLDPFEHGIMREPLKGYGLKLVCWNIQQNFSWDFRFRSSLQVDQILALVRTSRTRAFSNKIRRGKLADVGKC